MAPSEVERLTMFQLAVLSSSENDLKWTQEDRQKARQWVNERQANWIGGERAREAKERAKRKERERREGG